MASAFLQDEGSGLGASLIRSDSPGSSSASIIVPDAHLLFSAHFSRSGPDLVLAGTDGRHYLVPGYFSSEHPPALAAPNGATLSADVIGLMAGSAAPAQYAQTQPTAPPDLIGKVEKLVGDASVIRNGVSVTLHVGDAVFKSDVIETGSDSKVGIGFPDGTALELLANTRMALSEYSYDPNGHANSALFTYVEGTFGFFAGKVAHTGDMKIATPVATMGIRGTTGVMGQGTDASGHDFYWQSIYDDPGTNISGSWDDFGQNSNGSQFVEITVSQPGEMTVFTLQGPGLPPLITTIPIPDSYNLIALAIVDDLADIIRLLSVAPHSLGAPGSPENPLEVLPPENLPGVPGNGPQLIFYVPLEPPGGPPVIVPIVLPAPSLPGTQTGFIWPSGTGTWDTAFGWTGHEVPIEAIDTVTVESGVVQYGNNGADNYVISTLIVDQPGELDIVSGILNVQNGLDDAGKILVAGDPPSLTVSGPVTIEAGAKLIARGLGALIDIVVATVKNFGTIAARHGGDVEFIDDTVTNAAAIAGSGGAPGKIKSIGFGSVVDFTGVNFDNGGVVLAKDCGGVFFVDASVTNDAGARFTARDGGSITFSATPVDNSGVIRAIFGGFIKFEDLVTNESGGDIRSAGCNSCVVFCGNELDNSGTVTAMFGGDIKFFGATIVNEADGTTDDTTAPGGTIDAKDWGSVKVYGGSITNGAGALVEAERHGSIEIKDAFVLNSGKFKAADCGIIRIQGCEGSVINTGEFVARDFGSIVFAALSGVTNEDGGKIEARDDGRIVFADVAVTNYDSMLGGPFHHAGGGVIAAIGCGSQIDLADATIAGGRIETRDGGVIETVYGCNTFLNVTLDGAFVKLDCGTSLALDGGASGTAAVIDGCVVLAGGGVVTMAYESYRIEAGRDGGTLVNDTTISGLGQIGNGDGSLIFVNEGVLKAHLVGPEHGNEFIIDTGIGEGGAATTFNSGLMEACGPCVALLIENTAVDNDCGIIAAFGPGAAVELLNSVIAGGTLKTADPCDPCSGVIQVLSPGGDETNTVLFDGTGQKVTVDAFVQVQAGATLELLGTIDNKGVIDVDASSDSGSDLAIDGAVELRGRGVVTLDGSKDEITGIADSSAVLKNFSTIEGDGKIGDGSDVLTFKNGQNGTVDADVAGKTLVLDTGGNAVRNKGDLESTNGGILKIKSDVDNTGGTIGAFGANSLVKLIGVTVTGGTLATGDPYWLDDGVIAIAAAGGAMSVFDGLSHAVKIEGFVQVDPGAQLELQGNIDNNGGTVDVDQTGSRGSDILIDGTVTLSGDGYVALEGNSTGIVAAGEGGTLDNESYIYGSRGGHIGTGDDSLTFNNSGTVDSEAGEAGPLVLNTGDNVVTNTGTLEATGGSELDLYGMIDNTGGTIAALFEGVTSSLTVVKLFGATIEGGTLTTDSLTSGSNSMIEVTAGAMSEFDGSGQKVTVDGYVQVDAGANLALVGTIDNLGTIDVDGPSGADLVIDGTVKLKGDGDVILDDHKDQIVSGTDGATLDNFSNISGQGTIGDGSLRLINEKAGVIDADVNNKTLTIDTGQSVANHGTLEAANGGTLLVHDVVTGAANALAEGGVLHFAAAADIGDITFNNGTGTNYGEVIFDDPNGLNATVNGFTGTAHNLNHSDGIELAGIWTTESPLTSSGDNLVVNFTNGEDQAVTLTFDDFSGMLNIKDVGGNTLITDPPAAGSVNSLVSIGSGNDQFVFHPGIGAETIANFNPQHDTIELDHFTSAQTVQELQSLIAADPHGNAVVDLGNHDSITLPGMTAADLHAVLQTAIHLH